MVNRGNSAFSLLELFISLALIMIIVCMLIPRVIMRRDQVLIQELDKFETLFYSLQQRAIAQGKNLYLSFDLERQAYSYQTMHGKQHQVFLSPELCFGVVPETLGPPWQATKPVTSIVTFEVLQGKQCVKFFSNGKISSGSLYLCDKDKTIGGALTCAVSQVFYIRKYLYNDKQWKLINSQ